MKKFVMLLVFGLLVLGLVGAVSDNAGNNQESTITTPVDDEDRELCAGAGCVGDNSQETTTNRIRAGNYENSEGKKFQIQEKVNNQLRIHSGDVFADCDCNLTQEMVQNQTKLKVHLSNGRNAEIKVMPDVASGTALARLRLKVCSEENNCTIELKEVGKEEGVMAAYEVQVQRHFRVLGFFKTRAQVGAQVSAETGEVVSVKKPWWAFLASESEE